jgi:hypothetical protein
LAGGIEISCMVNQDIINFIALEAISYFFYGFMSTPRGIEDTPLWFHRDKSGFLFSRERHPNA